MYQLSGLEKINCALCTPNLSCTGLGSRKQSECAVCSAKSGGSETPLLPQHPWGHPCESRNICNLSFRKQLFLFWLQRSGLGLGRPVAWNLAVKQPRQLLPLMKCYEVFMCWGCIRVSFCRELTVISKASLKLISCIALCLGGSW